MRALGSSLRLKIFREGYVEEYQSDLKSYSGKNRKEGHRQR